MHWLFDNHWIVYWYPRRVHIVWTTLSTSWNKWLVCQTFYSADVLKGKLRYKLQNLAPETYYECKLRSVCNHVKSHYSESLTKQTLIQGREIFGFTYSIEWLFNLKQFYIMITFGLFWFFKFKYSSFECL